MTDLRHSGLAAETKVETPEGSMTIRACAGKAIPVLTRNDENVILFRMMLDIRKVSEAHPVLKLTLENGASFRVAPEQVFYLADKRTSLASRLQVGAALVPAFHYPAGYSYRADTGAELTSDQALKVAKVEQAGNAEIYALRVHQTGCFFLAAGVLCQADPAAECG